MNTRRTADDAAADPGPASPRDLAQIGAEFGELFGQELQLAAGDAVRSAILIVCVPPLLLLAWIGLSALLGWAAAFAIAMLGWPGATGYGIGVFSLLQLAVLWMIGSRVRTYMHSLTLPRTRRQVDTLMQAFQDEPDTIH